MLRIIVTALLFLGVSSPAFAQWTWLNPKPQGNALYDVVFLDDECAIAVGEAGTVLVSHDAGATWTVRTKVNGIAYRLSRIDRIDENTAVVVGTNSVIMRTSDQGASWTLVASSVAGDIADVSFADGVHGAALVGNRVIRSTDGGITWLPPVTLSQPLAMRAVDMITGTEGIAAGEFGTMFRTSNSGATWTIDTSLAGGRTFWAIDFLDATHGIVGSYFDSFVTSDGGTTWSPFYFAQHTDAEWTPNEILYVQPNLILAALTVQYYNVLNGFSSYGGSFMTSTNGGSLWTQETTPRIVGGLARNGDDVVVVVGDNGGVFRRVGNGPLVQSGGANDDYQLGQGHSSFFDAQVGILASSTSSQFQTGYSTFSRTADSGQSWMTTYVTNFQMNDLAHASAGVVYAVGTRSGATRGSIRHSLDGGATWSEIGSTTSPPAFRAIGLSSPSHAVAVGNSGGAVVVDGVTVSPVTTGTTSHLLDITFATPSIVIAVGTAGVIVRSSDSGQTWNLVPIDGTQTALVAVGFATADIGFVAGEDGNLRRTGDGGLTWLHSFHKDASAFYSINFLDGDHGMAVGKDGLVIATDNGGVTWENIDSPTTRTLNAVRMVGVHNAFISGFDRLLLGYSLQPVPTLITSFDAQPNPFSVDLSWAVRDEANLSEFRIERSDGLAGRTFRDIAGTSRSFRDNSVVSGSTYEYTLVALDNDGATTYSAPIRVTTSKVELALLPNVPNPFNPSTTVRYILPAREIARVTIYDVSGRLVTTLVNREEAAGSYEVVWNGTDDAGSHVASGVYLARIEAGKQSLSRKMVLLK